MDINLCNFESIQLSDSTHIQLWRWDKIHDKISGNKWFKLMGYAEDISQNPCDTIITFGGAYSNHLHATAHFCNLNALKCVCIIRGDEHTDSDNSTIQDLKELNADLHFVTRADYGQKEQALSIQNILNKYDNHYLIPEGGEGILGEKGFEILEDCWPEQATHFCISIGTGTSLKGIRKIIPLDKKIIGFSSFSNSEKQFPVDWLIQNNVEIVTCSHLGRFGQARPELIQFMNDFFQKHHIRLDIIYTGKMMHRLTEMIHEGSFNPQDRIVAIHTGGIQGNRSHSHSLVF